MTKVCPRLIKIFLTNDVESNPGSLSRLAQQIITTPSFPTVVTKSKIPVLKKIIINNIISAKENTKVTNEKRGVSKAVPSYQRATAATKLKAVVKVERKLSDITAKILTPKTNTVPKKRILKKVDRKYYYLYQKFIIISPFF